MKSQKIEIYTDGSCNPEYKIGGWASIILYNNQKIVLQGSFNDTTHNRMELIAVINSLEYVTNEFTNSFSIIIHTDSQYVADIPRRTSKLVSKKFTTYSGKLIQNNELVIKLIQFTEKLNIEFIKVKAHQKTSELINYNREVDKLCRKIVRQKIKET
ncbi:MAG: ribonuclease H [Bacteroidales bacterium]